MLMALHSGPTALMHGHSGCPRKQNSPSAKITPPSIPIKQRLDAAAMSYRLQLLLRHFKSCHLARMSDGHFCIIRDLGPVKGGKGLKHHEVVVDFSWRALAGFVLLRRRRSPLQALQAEISPNTHIGQKPKPRLLAASRPVRRQPLAGPQLLPSRPDS